MRFVAKTLIILLCLTCFQAVRGASWVKQDAGTLAWLHDVYFLNEKKGWIVGSNGEFLFTGDGGRTWNKKKQFTEDTIREVHFFDEKNGWLLCERDIYSLGSDAPSYLLTTSDGGETWNTVNFTGDVRKRITRIFFAGTDFGLAIGESGLILSVQESGSVWKRMPSPAPYLLNDGMFINKERGAIVGGGGTILFTEDRGITWKQSFVSSNANTKLNSVFFLDERMAWAVGANGNIYQTINGGRVWRKQTTDVSANLTDIFFLDTAEGWAIGENGTVLHSTTAGNVWTPSESKVKHKLEKILFVGKSGWIVGFGGTVLFYEAGNVPDNSAKTAPQIKRRN
ncbi:MAG: YCF48-related protein [Pyrinomonadaceae bacterium]